MQGNTRFAGGVEGNGGRVGGIIGLSGNLKLEGKGGKVASEKCGLFVAIGGGVGFLKPRDGSDGSIGTGGIGAN